MANLLDLLVCFVCLVTGRELDWGFFVDAVGITVEVVGSLKGVVAVAVVEGVVVVVIGDIVVIN